MQSTTIEISPLTFLLWCGDKKLFISDNSSPYHPKRCGVRTHNTGHLVENLHKPVSKTIRLTLCYYLVLSAHLYMSTDYVSLPARNYSRGGIH